MPYAWYIISYFSDIYYFSFVIWLAGWWSQGGWCGLCYQELCDLGRITIYIACFTNSNWFAYSIWKGQGGEFCKPCNNCLTCKGFKYDFNHNMILNDSLLKLAVNGSHFQTLSRGLNMILTTILVRREGNWKVTTFKPKPSSSFLVPSCITHGEIQTYESSVQFGIWSMSIYLSCWWLTRSYIWLFLYMSVLSYLFNFDFNIQDISLLFQVISTWGVKNKIDFLSLSYTRHAEDVREVKWLRKNCFDFFLMWIPRI